MKPGDFFRFDQGGQPGIEPSFAILVHQTQGLGDPYGGGFLASMHGFVADGNGGQAIGAGRLMSKADVEAVLRSMLAVGRPGTALLPPGVVSVSGGHVAWAVPAGIRPMLFNITGRPMKKVDVPWPRLLMVANRDGKLAVAALKTNGRVCAKTKLYHAPLMNVYANGNVCTGSAALPGGCGVGQLKAWESVMFDSAFSHVNNPSTLSLDGDKGKAVDSQAHLRFWLSLAKGGAGKFPTGCLNPMRQGIEEFIGCHG